jgi:hypothetical protein
MELLSPHARTRMQQRGIRADALGCLLDYGSESPSTGGRVLVHFDKAAQRRLEREADEATRKQMSRLAKIYLVVAADGTVVTVGHRYKRIQRH